MYTHIPTREYNNNRLAAHILMRVLKFEAHLIQNILEHKS